MTDRLERPEVETLREEVDLLSSEVDRLTKGPERPNGVSWPVRTWRRLFGRLVYDGPVTCGHCKYWTAPVREAHWERNSRTNKREVVYYKGDCKLLFGRYDTIEKDECDRFTPRRCYRRRVRDQ